MAEERFDTSPLSGRIPRERWRRFRADALAGRHGARLARPGRWRRREYALLAGGFTSGFVLLPGGLLITAGTAPVLIAVSAAWCACILFTAVMTLRWSRHDYWGPLARYRCRLTEFARLNGLHYAPEPSVARPAAHLFGNAPHKRHRDRIEVPGPEGFTVANYEETWDDGCSESYGFEAGYLVFRLRASYPRTLVTRKIHRRPRALRGVEPVDGPAGFRVWSAKPDHPPLRRLLDSGVVVAAQRIRASEIEIVGDELFVLNGGFAALDGPRVWRNLAALAETLAPFRPDAARGRTVGAPGQRQVDPPRPAVPRKAG